ncbi:hypothetical protein AQJ23_00115 [Streptomyces antibioticus]|nr:hypothetical protein [Streptomyces antibioticus]KUN29239.1 hypothetical protein AQJ23_00115 [Streptomyces antibioticus]
MTRIDDILSRALLVRARTVPADIIPTDDTPPTRPQRPAETGEHEAAGAAQDLRALCETLVIHTPATAVAEFITDQVPDPRSALVLACVLQLTDTDDGARFWWQYAAGAGQPAAAYCLYLHHLALGEEDTADWWHRQTDHVRPTPDSGPTPDRPAPRAEPDPEPETSRVWHPAEHRITSTSTSTILRILRHLATYTTRPRPAAVNALMAYLPTAVATGYLREPEIELPLPGRDFAKRIAALLAAAATRPDIPSTLPARSETPYRAFTDFAHTPGRPTPPKPVQPPVGETATR